MGKIILSCGHECKVRPMGFPVRLRNETCEAGVGFVKSVTYLHCCLDCYKELLEVIPEDMIFEDFEEEEYLSE